MEDKKPIILGIGGLLERGERGRINDLLDILASEHGCRTYEIGFTGVKRDGSTIVCAVSEKDKDSVEEVVLIALQDPGNDVSRIGVIVSSMGAVPFSEYAAGNDKLARGLKAYAGIAPFTQINSPGRTSVENKIAANEPVDFSSTHDIRRDIKRIVPVTHLPYVLSINLAETIKGLSPNYLFETLTLFGTKDERVDIESMQNYHKILNGKSENLLALEAGHTIPYELVRKPIIEFMVRTLGLNSTP